MKNLLKILIIVIAIILSLVIIAYFVVRAYLTPENMRYITSKMITEAIHYPVNIGAISLRFGFKIGVTIDDISIPNPPGFSPGQMIEIDKTSLNFKLIPLLRRQIVIGSIDLSGMNIIVERNRQNQINTLLIIPKEAKGTGWSLSLSSINMTRCNIQYRDAITQMEIHGRDINQGIKFRDHDITVVGSQSIYILKSKTLPEMVVKVNNNIEYATLRKNINIKKITLAYEPLYLDMAGTIEKLERLNINASLKIDELSKLSSLIPANSRPQRLAGSISVGAVISGTIKDPSINGQCELKNISIGLKGMNRDIEKIQGTLSFDRKSIKNINMQGQIANARFNVIGSVNDLNAPLLDLVLKASGNLKDIESLTDEMKDVKMSGVFNVDVIIKGTTKNPSYFGEYNISSAQIEGIGLARPLGNFNIKGNIQKNAAKIDMCSGNIGRTDFSLSGNISNFKKPIIQINCSSNLIDLDELLLKPQPVKKPEGKPVLLTLQGNIRIGRLIGMDMEFKNINTNFSFEGGIIDLKNCSAETFDGRVQFDFYYNSMSPEPFRITTKMTEISARKILKRFLNFDNLDAKLSGMANFQGRGLNKSNVITNLSAGGNIKFNNGIFKNFPFLTELLSWLGMKDYKELHFKDLVCYFNIDNGRAKVNDWALSTSIGNFLTNGTVGLDGRLNLAITTTLNKKESDLIKAYHGDWLFYFDKNGRAIIDIIVSGNLNAPQFKLDKDKIQNRLKGKIKDEFDRKKRELEDKLKELLKKK